jgi:hypothetical protein
VRLREEVQALPRRLAPPLFNERPEVFRAIAHALHGQVVMAVGRADPGAIGPLPPRVRAVPWVDDQAALLRRARLFVSHGGMNSVSEAPTPGPGAAADAVEAAL